MIEQKTMQLARYLVGKSESLDFSEPPPVLERSDSRQLRAKILALTQYEARKVGIGKSTLHYLRKNARSGKSFKVYKPVITTLSKAK